MKILHFGAGKIGRGLIFPFFSERHEVILADRNKELAQAIRDNNGYRLIELDYDGKQIKNIINPPIRSSSEIADIHDADAITTAVLVSNLAGIAPLVAEVARNNKRPLYIIPMENSPDAAAILRREVGGRLENTDGVFFPGSVIDRIVPAAANGLDIECEKYCSIIIENCPGFGDLVNEESLLTDNMKREFDKKFLLVNGLHASAAYLGYLRGHEHIRDVMADAVMRRKLEMIGECYIQYLVSVYGYREDELIPYFYNTLRRFSNPLIKDSLSRVGRNLLIKLAPTDRIIRPLLFNKRNGLDYAPLEEVVDAAGHFTIANDYEQYLSCLNELKPEAVVSAEAVLPSVDRTSVQQTVE